MALLIIQTQFAKLLEFCTWNSAQNNTDQSNTELEKAQAGQILLVALEHKNTQAAARRRNLSHGFSADPEAVI
jgi:hypothetical protein